MLPESEFASYFENFGVKRSRKLTPIDDVLRENCGELLKEVKKSFPQLPYDGQTNVWIAKPSNSTRGKGMGMGPSKLEKETLVSGEEIFGFQCPPVSRTQTMPEKDVRATFSTKSCTSEYSEYCANKEFSFNFVSKGIVVLRNYEDMMDSHAARSQNYRKVLQKYIERPLLIYNTKVWVCQKWRKKLLYLMKKISVFNVPPPSSTSGSGS